MDKVYDPATEKCCDDIGGEGDGYSCPSDNECCEGDCCDPDECESCIDEECVVCGGDTNKVCCDGTCCEAPIASISGPDTVDICYGAFSSTSYDPDGTSLSYVWGGGGTPSSGMGSSFSTGWPCVGTETVTLTVTDNDNPACCGPGGCCADKTDNDSKSVSVVLPSGCTNAMVGPPAPVSWTNPNDDFASTTCTIFGVFSRPHATYDQIFTYSGCSWVCEITDLEAETSIQVRSPASLLPGRVSVASTADVPCVDAALAKTDLLDTNTTDDHGAPRTKYWCYNATKAHEEKHRSDWQSFYGDKLNDAVAAAGAESVTIDCSDSTTYTCQSALALKQATISGYFSRAYDDALVRYNDPTTTLKEQEQRAYLVSYGIEQPISAALPAGCAP